MNRLIRSSDGEESTRRFGRTLGRALVEPCWIGLIGPLGAGKTCLAQGVAAGLGYTGRVRSPSFVLEHRYSGRVPIRHLDLYRLAESDEDLEASWDDAEGVVLVEWAERAHNVPARSLRVSLDPMESGERWITLEWDPAAGVLRDLRLETNRGGD